MVTKDVEIGIIGGTGVYDPGILEKSTEEKIYTPFGRTSSPITVGCYKGRRIAFIPRHGYGHQIPPHRIPFRTNIWALKELGVDEVFSVGAPLSSVVDYVREHVS